MGKHQIEIVYPSLNGNPAQYLFRLLPKWLMEVNEDIHGYKPQQVI
jgi:hypothetical protein